LPSASGAEADVQVIHPALEREQVRPARFALPKPDEMAAQDCARLLCEALLNLRQGARHRLHGARDMHGATESRTSFT
jgi:hypothetical protein